MTNGATLRSAWTLDPEVTFLNHGSFGACPSPVLAAQEHWRQRMEREPVRFFLRELETALDEARAVLAAFVGAAPADLAFVPNATTGVNTVLRSLGLAPGDEVLVLDHGYGACRNAAQAVAEPAGARVVSVAIPFPLAGPDVVVERVLEAAGPRCRLALVDHVTSPTGLILPLERLLPRLEERGIDTLVDGAHAPGMVELDVPRLGATYYTGNCHKWLCAPKGAGFLWVRADRRARVRPLVVSHGASATRDDRSRFLLEFDWTGTGDPTPYLCVPDALAFLGSCLPGGHAAVRRHNHDLVLRGRDRLCEALGIAAPAPDAMLGSLASVPVPDGEGAPVRSALHVDPLQEALWRHGRIEVPVFPWPAPPRRLLRISAQLYNDEGQYERLAAALPGLLGPGRGGCR